MSALELVASAVARPFVGRARPRANMTLNETLAWFAQSGGLPLMLNTSLHGEREEIESSYAGYVGGLYLRSPIVFGVLSLRARLFAEMRMVFQQLRNNAPGQFFGTPALGLLEHPEPHRTMPELLTWMILDADIAGDGFALGRADRIRRLRPDWTIMAFGAKQDRGLGGWDPDADLLGYGHTPGGIGAGNDMLTYLPEEVAHFTTNRDPIARNRGMSLLTPLIREVQADTAATSHKLAFFQNAATSNLVVNFPPELTKDAADEWIELFEQEHRGALNAYKAVYLGGGPTVTKVGSDMEQMTFAELQGKAETRIAMVAGMHPVVAALSEGLAGSSLNAGNFNSAARLVADATLRTLWRDVCGAFETLVPPPPGSRIGYRDRDIAFLRDDVKDQAEVVQKDGQTIGQLIRDGFTPDSAVDAVTSKDMNRLVHTGLVSVQLQAPGSQPIPAATVPTAAFRPLYQRTAYRVRSTFWALDEPFAQHGVIEAGTPVPADHPLAVAFPSVLAVDASADIEARVVETRRLLLQSGKNAGYDSIAAEMGVSRDTIRRAVGKRAA